ncbi:hypothetical protein OA50_05116 [Mameliella alba]|uniref:Uncharacterized protein n=1 Tax=Mameliella alba TaxID=561184 RepID=A0A0B3RU17_9RHOB|nr:hypothetical protein OA50_05116 [Mameliella alba]
MMSFVAPLSMCLGPSDALFSDVSKRPPDARPETIEALGADPVFGRWVIYQDRACDAFGCVQ